MSRVWIDEPRSNVIDLRPRPNPRHPSMQGERRVSLSQTEAELIASMLRSVRSLVPSPKGVDAAIELLTVKP